MAYQKGMRPGWLRASARLLNRAHKIWLWMARPMTVGVRVIMVRAGAGGQEVVLVRHTYHDGWLLPGGGVKRGETLEEAARREERWGQASGSGDRFRPVVKNLIPGPSPFSKRSFENREGCLAMDQ